MSDSDDWEEAPKPTIIKQTAIKPIIQSIEKEPAPPEKNDAENEELISIFFQSKERGMKQNELEKLEKEQKKEAIRKEREITEIQKARKFEFGDKGSNWRMMKLKRVYEIAKEEGLSVEDVARERYGTAEDFQEALDERKFLDSQRGGDISSNNDRGGAYRAPMKRSEFRAPDQHHRRRERDGPDQHQRRRDRDAPTQQSLKRDHSISPPAATKAPLPQASTSKVVTKLVPTEPILTTDQLNKLSSRVMKARLMKSKNLEALEEEYAYEKRRAETQQEVIILPTINAEGKLQDVLVDDQQQPKKLRTDTHDADGNRISYLNEVQQSLSDLVRQEKLHKGDSFDKELAHQISKDSTFKDNLDYVDEATGKLSRRKTVDAEKEKRNAVREHQKVETILQNCNFCYQEDLPPKVSIISMGLKSYLALPETIDMVPFHCLIVPIQHAVSSLELEDDTWDEIRNFKKCLIRMFEKMNMGVLFMEQVLLLKKRIHTVIECIPVPISVYQDAPGYFKEALMEVEGEWTQHKPILNTDRGFRKSMVKNLPYFHIWFDPNRGYGHVIEDTQEWPSWFGKEIIASTMDLPPDLWRRPKPIQSKDVAARSTRFIQQWDEFDWAKMLYE